MRKNFFLLFFVMILCAFISGGCGGSSDSFQGNSEPLVLSLLNGEWHVDSGHVEIYTAQVSADYVEDSIEDFNIKLTQNQSSDKYTITLTGDGVYIQDNTTSVLGQFEAQNDASYNSAQKYIVSTIGALPVVLGNNAYTKIEDFTSADIAEALTDSVDISIMGDMLPVEPIEIYSYTVAPGHISLFWLESGDVDTLYWEVVGNSNYYLELKRIE